MSKARIIKALSLTLIIVFFVCISGGFIELFAQVKRDPFIMNPVLRKRIASPRGSEARGPQIIVPPPISTRLDYFRKIRNDAIDNGRQLPKVTSVLLLDEMSVTGIFKTPRGYAAMIKAEPINLSFTIYPGDRFFDGQFVAVDENNLVFRKVTKWSNGSLVSSVERKVLRKYSDRQTVQGVNPEADVAPEANAQKTQSDEASSADKMKQKSVNETKDDEN